MFSDRCAKSVHTWLPPLWQSAFPSIECPADLKVVVKLWESIPPPLGLLADGDEGASEIDVGSYHAGVRQFFFSLLISSEKKSPVGVQRILEYANLSVPRARLKAHRPDGLQNLSAVGQLRWTALADILALANRRRTALLPVCRNLLEANSQPGPPSSDTTPVEKQSTWLCPLCGGPMVAIQKLTAQQILFKSF